MIGGSLGRDLKRILIDHGCRFLPHGEGNHEIWFSPLTSVNYAVDAGTGEHFTANAALTQAGIKHRF